MALPSVPPATSSWADAVTYGYYGDRTDPLPDSYYTVTGGAGSLAPAITAVTPASQAASYDGPWTMQCQGTFPIDDKENWKVVIKAADGSEWVSLDITNITLSTLVAHFLSGPNYPEAHGAGTVHLRYGTATDTPGVTFTWT